MKKSIVDTKGEIVYLVYTDVKGSTNLDKKCDPIKWRIEAFCKQLEHLLSLTHSLALKSIGDALFVIYEDANNRKKEEELIKEILYGVWQATQKVSYNNQNINIRAVIHRIVGHKRGNAIATKLTKINTNGDKTCFQDILKKDIFGNEVNKAARILSLNHGSCVLLSEEIVKIINNKAVDYAKQGKNIDFGYKGMKFILQSPVPILTMKGVFNCLKSRRFSPCVVWELNTKEAHSLATEFKSSQALRLILVRLKNAEDISQKRDKIIDETLKKLSIDNPNLVLRFYLDMLWKVIDYFIFHDAEFKRIDSKIDSENYLESMKQIVTKIQFIDNKATIPGQAGELIISADQATIGNVTYIEKNTGDKAFLVSLLGFTSYPDINHGICVRRFLSNDSNRNLIATIEPQSIEVYRTIMFNSKIVKKYINKDPGSTDFHAFLGKKCILFIFQIYFPYLHQSDNLRDLFNGVEEIDENLEMGFYGLTTGLTDGFVLYICKDNKTWDKDGLPSILKKLVSIRNAKSFYQKIYPIAIFVLEEYAEFVAQKKNITYLKNLNT